MSSRTQIELPVFRILELRQKASIFHVSSRNFFRPFPRINPRHGFQLALTGNTDDQQRTDQHCGAAKVLQQPGKNADRSSNR